MKKFEILQELSKCDTEVSKCSWKNGADIACLMWGCLQFVKKKKKGASVCKKKKIHYL